MSETPDTPAVTPAVPAAPAPEAKPETFSREYVEQLRQEAASARTSKRDAVEAAKAEASVEWQEKINTLISENTRLGGDLGNAWVELAKVQTALDLEVPAKHVRAFADLLKGDTEEAIKASAEAAKTLFGGLHVVDPATDPTQGKGGKVPALNSDALLTAVSAAVNRGQ